MTTQMQESVAPTKVKSILVSQPKPEGHVKSPYYTLAQKYGLDIEFRPFIRVEQVTAKEFRKTKINLPDYTAVIFTSKNAITHFFHLCEEMRVKMSQETKYFCSTEAIALFLQNFIFFRKRKVFFAKTDKKNGLQDLLKKHRKGEKYVLTCTNNRIDDLPDYLRNNNFDFVEAPVYQTVYTDFSDMNGKMAHDMVIFFSPIGVQSLLHNFPNFEQGNVRIGAFGPVTAQAVTNLGLRLDLSAPHPDCPSMTTAIEHYLKKIGQEALDENRNLKVE